MILMRVFIRCLIFLQLNLVLGADKSRFRWQNGKDRSNPNSISSIQYKDSNQQLIVTGTASVELINHLKPTTKKFKLPGIIPIYNIHNQPIAGLTHLKLISKDIYIGSLHAVQKIQDVSEQTPAGFDKPYIFNNEILGNTLDLIIFSSQELKPEDLVEITAYPISSLLDKPYISPQFGNLISDFQNPYLSRGRIIGSNSNQNRFYLPLTDNTNLTQPGSSGSIVYLDDLNTFPPIGIIECIQNPTKLDGTQITNSSIRVIPFSLLANLSLNAIKLDDIPLIDLKEDHNCTPIDGRGAGGD